MGDADANVQDRATLRTVVLALELVAAAVITGWALVNVWTLAHPPAPGTVCMLTYPGPPGCSPELRFTAAFVSAVVISLSYSAVTFVLLTVGRHRGLAAAWGLGGLLLLGVLADQFVTWGGPPG